MSGTIVGARTGAYGPRIMIEWKVLEQDIAGNRSKIQAISYMDVAGTISYTGRHSVNITIDGSRTTKTALSSSSGAWKRELNRHTAWVNHKSDGTRSFTIASSYNVQITWRGQWISNISAGATVTVDSIPRASTINSASIPYSLQAPKGTATPNAISISLSKKLSSYTHYIRLSHGNTFIGEWNESNPTSLELNATHVTRIFNALPNATSGTFKLTVTTKNGNSNIGSTSRNITANLHSNSTPYFRENTLGINGNGKDKEWGTYIQNFSKLSVSSSASPGLGARINSMSVSVGNSSIASSKTGDLTGTSKVLTDSGNVLVKYTVVDSRGLSTTETKTINVIPYITPSVNVFSVNRDAETRTTANISYNVSYSPVNGNNKLNIVTTYSGSASGTPINKYFTGTGTARATESSSYSVTNLNKFGNFDFDIEITDSLGNTSTTIYSMTSSELPLSIDKNNKGIGVGKDYERGALDVSGDVYVDGGFEPIKLEAGDDLNNIMTPNNYYCNSNAVVADIGNTPDNFAFSLTVVKHAGVNQMYTTYRTGTPTTYTRNYYNGVWGEWKEIAFSESSKVSGGSNENGDWVRFSDGTQIAWKENVSVNNFQDSRKMYARWTLPVTFVGSRPACFVTKDYYYSSNAVNKATLGSYVTDGPNSTWINATVYYFFGDDAPAGSHFNMTARAMVIGRWK